MWTFKLQLLNNSLRNSSQSQAWGRDAHSHFYCHASRQLGDFQQADSQTQSLVELLETVPAEEGTENSRSFQPGSSIRDKSQGETVLGLVGRNQPILRSHTALRDLSSGAAGGVLPLQIHHCLLSRLLSLLCWVNESTSPYPPSIILQKKKKIHISSILFL